jgi:hypothetical protein
MKDLMLNQESFVRDSISIRLKNLAAHLNQIGVQVSGVTPAISTITLTDESLYFIEWTVPNLVDIDVDWKVSKKRCLTAASNAFHLQSVCRYRIDIKCLTKNLHQAK